MRKMPGHEFDELVAFFDQMAQTEWLSEIHWQLIDRSGDWAERDVIDIGCGTGRLLLKNGAAAGSITGIDLSENMIQAANLNAERAGMAGKSHFSVGDAYRLPFTTAMFDVALSTCVMFLLPEPEKGIEEMLRVLKPGGRIAMLNPSEKMSPEAIQSVINDRKLTGFEKETLEKWSNVSTKRHRYSQEQLDDMFAYLGATSISHTPVLAGHAYISIADKSDD